MINNINIITLQIINYNIIIYILYTIFIKTSYIYIQYTPCPHYYFYNSFFMFDDFDNVGVLKRDNIGNLLQNKYCSSYRFCIIFGRSESMCNIDESLIEVNSGQAALLSIPSIVGVLKNIIKFKKYIHTRIINKILIL